ncbi:DUF1772 domain-containing protein [Microbacterium sp. STN6]|uniref:anthrone oxygenase family protein n=1 Tax=Microbacterium sp. STN6 TaxID=2995588 RepID=UPI0022608306|nr:anthrone oxygenase family protein [Microbacterium sp. STN6]MCX7521063.1 DUF1772 domain-containing protein [Microbacterium sp. STN6]
MNIAIGISAILAIVGIAVIFGADVLAAVVLRPVYAGVDDRTLVQAVGRGHHFGDRRLPIAGIGGVVFTALAAALAFVGGAPLPAALATAALALLLVWLVLFTRIAKPINRRLSTAALANEVPADARALQDRWESIITVRAIIQGAALLLLCAVLLVG